MKLICAITLTALSLSAQVTLRWACDTARPASASFDVWRGETVSLEPSFSAYGSSLSLTNASATLYWSTNAAAGWWTKPADIVTGSPDRVRAVFAPTNDCGASAYSFFIKVAESNSASYRAFGQLTLRGSPGTNPTNLPAASQWPDLVDQLLPLIYPQIPTYAAWTNEAAARAAADLALSQRIDALDETAVLDEAALRIAADSAGSNYTAAASANLQTQLTAIASFTGLVGRASSSDSALRLISSDSNWWVSVSSGTATLWRVSVATNQGSLYYGHYDLTLSSNFQTSTGIRPSTNYWHDLQSGITTDGVWRIYINSAAGPYKFSIQYNGSGGSIWANGSQTVLPTNTINYTPYYGTPTPQGTGTLSVLYYPSTYIYSTNCAGTYVTAADLAVGISNALASYNPSAATNALALASNAWQQATLAQSQIVAATNALVQTYLLNSNAWITANWSNQTLAVSLVQTNGTTNVVSVGGNNSIDPAATNLIWIALNQSIASIALKADKAWGNYAPDGTSNPDPNYMLWLNKPATLFASGCSWETYGTYAVLLSTGTVAFASGTNGAFRVGPDSTNYFGYIQGGSVTVGAVADSINVVNAGQAGGYAEITYLYSSGDFPVIWFTPSLSGVDFSEISGVWVDNLDGTATVTVPAESAGGFYKATTSATFSNYFLSTMPARFAGGVVGATNDTPVVYNSTISISSGGHTYRIPAQFVQ